MKILFISQYLSGGGLERMVHMLAENLHSKHGCSVFLYAFDGTPSLEIKQNLAAKSITAIHELKSKGFSFKTAWSLARLLRKEKIDVIHTHESAPLIYAVLAKVLSFKRTPIVHTQHSFVHLKTKPYIKHYDRFFQRMAAFVSVVSNLVKDEYVKLGVAPSTLTVIENGVEFPSSPLPHDEKISRRSQVIKSLGPAGDKHAGDVWLLSLARIHNRKGQEHLIKVWNKLSEETRLKCVLLFVGPTTDEKEFEKLQQMKTSSQNSERIIFAGSTTNPGLWIQLSDIFLSGSEYEGLPLAPLEAAGAGLPSILSDIPGHESLNLAYKFSFNDPKTGAQCIQNVITDLTSNPEFFITKNWEKASEVRNKFSVDRMGESYYSVYKSVQRGNKR